MPHTLKSRLRRNPPHKDGTPGRFYLRLRVAAYDRRLKSITLDIPLETADPQTATNRAGFVLRTLQRVGARILGDISDILSLTNDE